MSPSQIQQPGPKRSRLTRWSRIVTLGFYIVIAAAAVYAIATRTLEDFLRYPAQISALLLPGAASLLVMGWANSRGQFHFVRALLRILLLLAFTGFTYYCLGVVVKDLYAWLPRPSYGKPISLFLAGVATGVVGLALFLFRLRFRFVYGLSEVLVGVLVAVHRLTGESSQPGSTSAALYLAILTAGVYLVVRGLDNMHQGLTRAPIDPLGRKLALSFGFKFPDSLS